MEAGLIVILVLAFHAYIGYPVFLRFFRRARVHVINPLYRPSVSLVVSAYNEIDVIEAKILNSLSLDYPAGLMEFIFASDGSDDGTTQVIRRFQSDRFRPIVVTPRGGKAGALRKCMEHARGDIVILSDANTMIAPNAVRTLVRHFSDPSVGAVTGDVRIEKASGGYGESEGIYYRIERFIQLKESQTGSVMGVDGALYAVRRDLFDLPDDQVILDDFVASMTIVNQGYRVLFDPEALATENATPSISQEFRRKSRIVAGGFQSLFRYRVFPTFSRPWELFCFISHKVLRWFLPCLLSLLILLNVIIVILDDWWGYTALLISQAIFYLLGTVGWVKEGEWKNPLVSIPFYFIMVNLAGLTGFFRFLNGTQKVTWRKTDRLRVEG
jgi:cellulose synthase/poly-beta-1,6-N-acetylglucosamine synthase-like glycosyltransferase